MRHINLLIKKIKNNVKKLKPIDEHVTIYCDINKCVNIYCFSFAPQNGWHFYVETLKQYIENPKISYQDTYMARYFNNFQPQNCYEALMKSKNSDSKVYNELSRFRDPQNAPMPWTPYSWFPDKYHTNLHGYGPKSINFQEKEFKRLVNVYENIKQHGFKQEHFARRNDYIRGIILKNQNKFKFLILSGVHRTSVLSAIGYTKVPVNVDYHKFPCVIDIDNISNWPCVKLNIYSKETAEAIFNNYFTEDGGINKAIEWGIIS